jgi:hypothetical protein
MKGLARCQVLIAYEPILVAYKYVYEYVTRNKWKYKRLVSWR